MTKKNDPDSDLFRATIGEIKRLRVEQAPAPQAKPSPQARFRRADEERVLEESLHGPIDPATLETGEELLYRRPGVQERVLRRLRRGAYRVAAEIDLHGMTVPEARAQLGLFLRESIDLDLRCVRVIHGKGRKSGNRGPVLKGKVDIWLRRRIDVIAFASAPLHDGGTGAVYVLLGHPPTRPRPR